MHVFVFVLPNSFSMVVGPQHVTPSMIYLRDCMIALAVGPTVGGVWGGGEGYMCPRRFFGQFFSTDIVEQFFSETGGGGLQ